MELDLIRIFYKYDYDYDETIMCKLKRAPMLNRVDTRNWAN